MAITGGARAITRAWTASSEIGTGTKVGLRLGQHKVVLWFISLTRLIRGMRGSSWG